MLLEEYPCDEKPRQHEEEIDSEVTTRDQVVVVEQKNR